jgi:hypothetical protein
MTVTSSSCSSNSSPNQRQMLVRPGEGTDIMTMFFNNVQNQAVQVNKNKQTTNKQEHNDQVYIFVILLSNRMHLTTNNQ